MRLYFHREAYITTELKLKNIQSLQGCIYDATLADHLPDA